MRAQCRRGNCDAERSSQRIAVAAPARRPSAAEGVLVGDDDRACQILSHHRPPPVIGGCSQAVWRGNGGPGLVRNYDFALDLASDRFEITWSAGLSVIAKAQRPWGGGLEVLTRASYSMNLRSRTTSEGCCKSLVWSATGRGRAGHYAAEPASNTTVSRPGFSIAALARMIDTMQWWVESEHGWCLHHAS